MSSFRIAEAYKRVERATAGQAGTEPDVTGQLAEELQAAILLTPSSIETGPDGSDASDIPADVRITLAACARDYPGDGARWEALLHNAWQLGRECPDQSLFWTFITFRAGGCQLVPHEDAGWAIRFDANKATTLQDEAGLLFASEAAYRAFAGKYLAPRRSELTRLLSWSSLGVLEEQEDMSWAWVDADRRRRAAMKEVG